MDSLITRLRSALQDRYAIERELGRGGMATVFLAHDLKHGRQVAIKVLLPELARALGPERFLREITLAARLSHPQILPLHDSGEADGLLYYVMPYVAGESLRARLDKEPQLPLAEVRAITRGVAAALSYAHGQGVIHRDVKPENVLLSAGQPLLADFGIARAVEAAGERLTETGLALGTAAYMSPEQAAGERILDGRSDQYSLGTLVYEMLAGEPPYTGPSMQAVVAKHMSSPVPSVRVVRAALPPSVDAAIRKALAKAPADRFATVAEFIEALEAPDAMPHTGPVSRARSPALPGRAVAAVLLPVVVVAAFLLWRGAPHGPAAVDPNVLAITPFEVHDTALQLWGEGLVDVLSRDLDGAGPLRTVPLSVLLPHWKGPSDRASAAALGRATGAGMVAFGDLVPRGRDSVTVRATVLNVATDAAEGEVVLSGLADRIGDLADSLARELLGTLGRGRPIAAVQKGSLGSAPLPALKAFLKGEQFYRRGGYDSALVYYDKAIAQDSNMALAFSRMAQTVGWYSPQAGRYQEQDVYGRRAILLNHGQAPRDSLLLTADSCHFAALDLEGKSPADPERQAALLRRDLSLRKEATDRYPGDPEVWYGLGEKLYHFSEAGTAAEALAAFDRAITLDPGFTPAYEHVAQLAMETDGLALARRYLRAYQGLRPAERFESNLRFAAGVLDLDRATRQSAAEAIDTIRAQALNEAWKVVEWWPDSAETALRLHRHLLDGRHSYAGIEFIQIPDLLHQRFALALATRGHLRQAWQWYDDSVRSHSAFQIWNPFPELAMMGAPPEDTVAGIFGQALQPGTRWPPPYNAFGLDWWAARRDTASLRQFVARTAAEAPRAANYFRRARIEFLGAMAAAYLALARGDSAAALAGFEALARDECSDECPIVGLTRARLQAAFGRDQAAAATLDRWTEDRWGIRTPSLVVVLGRLERARIAERLGERDLAIRYYRFVADIWRQADPELTDHVRQAREGLRRLGA